MTFLGSKRLASIFHHAQIDYVTRDDVILFKSFNLNLYTLLRFIINSRNKMVFDLFAWRNKKKFELVNV